MNANLRAKIERLVSDVMVLTPTIFVPDGENGPAVPECDGLHDAQRLAREILVDLDMERISG